MPKVQECLRPHALVHLATGAGLGLLLAGVLGGATTSLGVVLLVAGLVGEFFFNK